MSEYYLDTNWGPILLPLVARGSAINCEICRLSDYIPAEYKSGSLKNEYSEILCDFSYFSISESFEHKIDSRPELQDLDEKFRENHMELIDRFYRLFESIYKYVSDLNQFLLSLEDGHFVQHDLVSVMQDEDGKQLMCEALYLYGVMLLLIEQKIEGTIREKLLVSYHRYSSKQSNLDSNTDEVIKLLRSTGYNLHSSSSKRPLDYPEKLFNRISINAKYVAMVLDKLRSDDFYHQTLAYPLPEHRSVARATQANMIYVCLYFAPNYLHNQQAIMREIVDKHFSDNWVLGGYLGHIINLVDDWAPYKSANIALTNTIETSNVRLLVQGHCHSMKKLIPNIENILKEGVLVEEFVLDKIAKLMDKIRECNVTIRWLMLHSSELSVSAKNSKKCVALRDAVVNSIDYNEESIFNLLVLTSQFELKLGEMFRSIIENKETSWNQIKLEGVDRMKELAEVFSGTKALARVSKNDKLQTWFEKLAKQIENLSFQNSTFAGRTLDQLIQALHEVLEFHQLDSNLMVKQFINDTCASLKQMMRLLNLQERVLVNLSICSDISYGLNIIDRYTGYMQSGITKDPFLVIKLRAVFLKLASSHDIPLIRLNQCSSGDLISVTQYYSSELVQYVRKVLQIIPQTMFKKLAKIIDLQTNDIKELPTRLDKDKVKNFLFFEQRGEIAKLTHDISVFTQGILMMKTTLVGIIELDPHKLLEDGIRKELIIHVSKAFDSRLVFSQKSRISELDLKLDDLSNKMDGFRRSFEYIQDYVNIYGLKIWREEVSRIINFNVEKECNVFMRKKILEYQSIYQSKSIPIPSYAPIDDSATFVGRLIKEILKVTDPKTSIYVSHVNSWYDLKTKVEVANIKLFTKLESVFNSFGLCSLDRLVGLLLVKHLQHFLQHIQLNFKDSKNLETLNLFLKAVNPISTTVSHKIYSDTHNRLSKILQPAVDIILKIGQLQLIRKHFANQLNLSSKFESKFLHSALITLNNSLLHDLDKLAFSPATCPYPAIFYTNENENETEINNSTDIDTDLIYHTNKLLHSAGLHDPISQIYITTQKFRYSSVYPCIILTSVLGKLIYSKTADTLISKKTSDALDGYVLSMGITTLLQQMHPIVTKEWIGLMGQYVRSLAMSLQSKNGVVTYPTELINSIAILQDFCYLSRRPINALYAFIPEYLIDDIRTQIRNSD